MVNVSAVIQIAFWRLAISNALTVLESLPGDVSSTVSTTILQSTCKTLPTAVKCMWYSADTLSLFNRNMRSKTRWIQREMAPKRRHT